MSTEGKLDQRLITSLIARILTIEKRYAHELKGVRDQRRNEIKDLINKVLAEKSEK